MPKFRTQFINPHYKIEVNKFSHPAAFSKRVWEQVESIWEHELQQRKGELFNGQLLSMISFNEQRLVSEFIDYKLFVAQLRHKALKQEFEIIPVCISGITLCQDHVLLGKRAEFVIQEPGKWECPPSGGIDATVYQEGKIDLQKLIWQELEEETHLLPSFIARQDLFALVHDLEKDVIDLCVRIELKPESLDRLAPSTKEYPELQWVPFKDLLSFASRHHKEMVPLSLHLMKLQKLIA